MASYQVDVSCQAKKEIRRLPGNIRQRVIRELKALKQEPRPYNSRLLDADKAAIELKPGVELRRIQIASWRIIYLIEEKWKLISTLAIRKRPPYQYDNLNKLVKDDQD